ncbi:phosphogluconate dehydratase [Chelatococcus daeguensis]|uniref:Phosphogluconate dehydratase n=2 Tax=Chelatococcus TaxID=28209 RepID=A0AAC9NYK8_9HYPH|nr:MULTISPECIES: phosphogluconate dehydratase [Chelatococcus]APF37594.1 phosphogluconate dehydratase [Chelatococcus daeguensis]KZE35530.1 phosphogluconate dehydratase [Chelatococcus daeguensis]MBM3085536.1 phosphogluconate dehydratase [Chelatococcus daeguensis]CUA86005.1 6-phosphogluconate dehydratase [Chelatococcus sambhunathii]
MTVQARIGEVTERIARRSRDARTRYLERIAAAAEAKPRRGHLGCANLAHGFAACGPQDKERLAGSDAPNLGIVTAYNDMLSAHQPFERFPELIRAAVREAGGTAQVAGGVPAMCDGVTQGEAGMELSLFSRDVIALSTAVALSHQMFDAAVFLGVCDKIVPGLVIGALSFGHLPAVFVPAGPMTSGLSNDEKAKTRQLYAEGKVGRDALLESEMKSYHGPGTCTFYGTANSNQMLMEIMGLHLPGASFVNPNTSLRDALTQAAARRAIAITALGNEYTPVGRIIDEKAVVNGVVGLHATGGSTNHTLHLVAMAAAAGITLTWDDFADLAEVTPLLARVYPNGKADVNHFHAAGGMGFLIRELLGGGLLHRDVTTVWGTGLDGYLVEPGLDENGGIAWREAASESGNTDILRGVGEPFQPTGGLRVLDGPLGRAVIKTSAVAPERHVVEAPARVFHSQEELQAAFRAGVLTGDFVAVVRYQGPKANGMPELHKLTPPLTVLQDRGQRVALVTDGRMSGASGKVPAAIHVTPEAADGGAIARIRDGDIIRVDALSGRLDVLVDATEFAARAPVEADLSASHVGVGRELFAGFRHLVGTADKGATVFPA